MSPTEFIDRYENNRAVLIQAITQAGGNGAAFIHDGSMSLREFLGTLASNHIRLDAVFSPPPPIPTLATADRPTDTATPPAVVDGEGNTHD